MSRLPTGSALALLAASCSLVTLSCKPRAFNQVKATQTPATKGSVTRSEFYGSDKVWFVNIFDWDRSRMKPWEIGTDASTYGAVTEVIKIDPNTSPSCPTKDVKPEDRVFSTQKFKVSIRGNASRGTPKSSYMIKFTDPSEAFLGQKMLHMLGTWNDMSGMREAITGSLHRFMNVPAPRHTFARLCVNGTYYGLYSIVEHVDDGFFEGVMGLPDAGNMYEGAVVKTGTGDLQKREGDALAAYGDKGYKLMRKATGEDFTDLAKLIDAINGVGGAGRVGSAEWKRNLESVFEVKTFLRWMAVNNLVGGWDNYYWNPNNYFIVNAKGKGTDGQSNPLFRWIAVDLDNSFGLQFNDVDYRNASIIDWEGVRQGVKLPLVTNLLKDREYKTYYLDAMEYLLETKFNEKSIYEQQVKLFGLVSPSVYFESNTPLCDNPEPAPYNCAHTGRQYANDEIQKNVIARMPFTRIKGMRSPSIADFTRDRSRSASSQIARLRANFPRVTRQFPAAARDGSVSDPTPAATTSEPETLEPIHEDMSIREGAGDGMQSDAKVPTPR